jgi:hypothetical protein
LSRRENNPTTITTTNDNKSPDKANTEATTSQVHPTEEVKADAVAHKEEHSVQHPTTQPVVGADVHSTVEGSSGAIHPTH